MKTISESSVGGRVRKARTANKMTLKDLAEKVGVSLNHLSLVERGDKMPSVALLKRIADAVGVSYDLLKDGAITESAPKVEPDTSQVDMRLLFTLILMEKPTLNEEYLATALRTSPDIIKAILSGKDTASRPLWQEEIKLLSRQLDVSSVCNKLENLVKYLKQEENAQKEQRYAVLEDALKQYYESDRHSRIQRREPIRESNAPVSEATMVFESCTEPRRYVEFHYVDIKGHGACEAGREIDTLIQAYTENSFAEFTESNREYFVVWEDEVHFELFVKKANILSSKRLENNPSEIFENGTFLVNAIWIDPETFEILKCEACCSAEIDALRRLAIEESH